MKFLTWFVSVLIVVVMCTPCMDSAAAVPMQSASFQTSSPTQDHTAFKDGCSPFCTCACCSVPTFVQNTSISVEVPQQTLAEYTQKSFGKAIGAEISVWQPPKLG